MVNVLFRFLVPIGAFRLLFQLPFHVLQLAFQVVDGAYKFTETTGSDSNEAIRAMTVQTETLPPKQNDLDSQRRSKIINLIALFHPPFTSSK